MARMATLSFMDVLLIIIQFTISQATNTTSALSEIDDNVGGGGNNDDNDSKAGLWVVIVAAILILCTAQVALIYYHFRNKEMFEVPQDDDDTEKGADAKTPPEEVALKPAFHVVFDDDETTKETEPVTGQQEEEEEEEKTPDPVPDPEPESPPSQAEPEVVPLKTPPPVVIADDPSSDKEEEEEDESEVEEGDSYKWLFTKMLHVQASHLARNGSRGTIDRDDFLNYFCDKIGCPRNVANRLFDDMDKEKSDTITSDRYRRWKQKHPKPEDLKPFWPEKIKRTNSFKYRGRGSSRDLIKDRSPSVGSVSSRSSRSLRSRSSSRERQRNMTYYGNDDKTQGVGPSLDVDPVLDRSVSPPVKPPRDGKLEKKRGRSRKRSSGDHGDNGDDAKSRSKSRTRSKSKTPLKALESKGNLTNQEEHQWLHTKVSKIQGCQLPPDETGKIEKKAFVQYFKRTIGLEPKVSRKWWKEMDTKGTGKIAAKDFDKWKKKHPKPSMLQHLFK